MLAKALAPSFLVAGLGVLQTATKRGDEPEPWLDVVAVVARAFATSLAGSRGVGCS
jgi:hypothetical protein